MVQRKRPRRACSSCCQDVTSTCSTTTAQHHQFPFEESMVHRQPQEQHLYQASRQRRQRHRHGKVSASWKMTMAAFLLWLCENGKNHNFFFFTKNDNAGSPAQSMVQAWGSGSGYNGTVHTTRKGLQIVGSCSKEEFLVRNVYLLCDSPGAYYRGSYTYRDSTTCTYGDKARLKLEFSITDSFTGASSIRLEIESGIYDQWKRVAIMDDLCNYDGSNLQRIYNEYESTTSCPTPGLYQLDTYFVVPAFTSDMDLHYTPDVRLRFYNAKGRVLGCATTGTLALSRQARDHAEQGLVALMTAFFALMCLFSTLIYLNYGRERRILADKRKKKGGSYSEEGPSEMRLEPVLSNPQTIASADNDGRYHYFHSNGEQPLNGSSDLSNTSNAASSISSHHPRKI